MSTSPPSGGPDRDDDELLPEQTADDTDRGWGDDTDDTDGTDRGWGDDTDDTDDAADDDERLLRERPPHW